MMAAWFSREMVEAALCDGEPGCRLALAPRSLQTLTNADLTTLARHLYD
jgi:hypothetical protein